MAEHTEKSLKVVESIKSAQPKFNSANEALAALVHATMIQFGFRLVGFEQPISSEGLI